MAISLSVRTICLSRGKIRKKQFFFEKRTKKLLFFWSLRVVMAVVQASAWNL
jgi:hypothetical protein